MREIKLTILMALTILFLIAPCSWADEFNFHYQKMLEIGSEVDFELSLTRGTVLITGGTDDGIRIDAVKHVRATSRREAEEIADHIEIRVDQDGNQVRVSTNCLRMLNHSPSIWSKLFGAGADSYGSVDYTITLPITSSVAVTAISGEINISSIEGKVEINNTSGTSHVEFLFGPVKVVQDAGKLTLQWIEGDIRVRTKSCQVNIRQVQGALDVFTITGDVDLQTELDSPRDYYVQTTSGTISFRVPELSSGTLNIESMTGAIKADVPITISSVSRRGLIGQFGEGGPRIKLTTSSGDVAVAQY